MVWWVRVCVALAVVAAAAAPGGGGGGGGGGCGCRCASAGGRLTLFVLALPVSTYETRNERDRKVRGLSARSLGSAGTSFGCEIR